MKTSVSFCNLIHNDHRCRAVGYGIAQVASYAIKHLENQEQSLKIVKITKISKNQENHEKSGQIMKTLENPENHDKS